MTSKTNIPVFDKNGKCLHDIFYAIALWEKQIGPITQMLPPRPDSCIKSGKSCKCQEKKKKVK